MSSSMDLVLHHFWLVLQDNTPIDQLAGLTAATVQVGARDWVAPGERHRPGLQVPSAAKTRGENPVPDCSNQPPQLASGVHLK